ncbi:LptF/LptG family permease [Cyanobacterium aponinum UTEX 3222]|uniref:Permease YjgP/YjgQ family protein n=2 Tax=Cyanobacterium aponinum TaxID=379064 RepID=K9Z4N6_CYAAP|nr:LptF/LptG family permease [Cyanobacterium aponinum]WRL41770.1 LptF/LptG family permease [Cyanobacterium aponinum UTEX 3222]AFZ53363.1 permease YjgP/YjgQ family protein [Cyanobacterium aponinum PCC 10605]MBD2395378.1 LptF/LptG family permease [Cyanobacterium aponinum FACHB-4101]MTF39108.1 LptF/LptG family permease [Cyanobacterium aponinum 0216]PHV62957.1 YjgP/YjgQ family permease [Cyanobacterium aponinum IPPAS B-1201]
MRPFKFSILDSYLFQELIPPFIFSVAIFSTLGVAIATLSDLSYKIVNANLPFIYALQIFFLKIPEYVAYALPISVLLTTLMTYSRLSKDSELIAFYNCGLSLYRLITPALILSLIVTGLTFIFNELIVPNANYKATTILVEQINEQRKFLLRQDIFYPEYVNVKEKNGKNNKYLKTLFYAQEFDGENMQSLTILDTEKKGLNKVIISEKGTWNNQDKVWDLFNGFIYDITKNQIKAEGKFFEKTQISLPKTPLELASKSRDPYEMNIIQSLEYIKLLRLLGDDKTVLMFQVRTAQKISFPFVCVIFGLVGSSLGSRPNNASKATSFGLCVGIVFFYYLGSFMISSLGLIGIISPLMAAWIPNFIGLLIGGFLLAKENG